jgi:hypothetical protein
MARLAMGPTPWACTALSAATEAVKVVIRATPRTPSGSRSFGRRHADPDVGYIATADLVGDYPAIRYYPPTGVQAARAPSRVDPFDQPSE